jgi:hypothetical protein
MKKIKILFFTGLLILVIGLLLQNLGHKFMSIGLVLSFIGFIISGAFGLTWFQLRNKQK